MINQEREIDSYYLKLNERHVYESTGLPFNSNIAKSIDDIKKRINKNIPAAIIIDGISGMGKTTLAYHIAEYAQGYKVQPVLQHGQGTVDFIKKAKMCIENKIMCPIFDEAGDADKRQFWSEINKMLNRFFDLYRTFKLIPIICLPTFDRLEDTLFDKAIPRLLLNCHDKKNGYSNIKVYSLYRMLYLRAKMKDKKLVSKQMAYKFVRPNYRARFKDLPYFRSKDLDKFSSSGKLKEFHEIDIMNRGLITYKDMAQKLGRSEDWVKRQVSKLKIKEVEIWKRRKYFSKKEVTRLKNTMFNQKMN